MRELQNCIERAVILADGETMLPRHLNLSFAAPLTDETPESPWTQADLAGTLSEVTRRVTAEVETAKIREVLAEAGGNKGRAAELLQVSYKALLAKLNNGASGSIGGGGGGGVGEMAPSLSGTESGWSSSTERASASPIAVPRPNAVPYWSDSSTMSWSCVSGEATNGSRRT